MRHLGSDRLRLWSPLIAIQPEPSRPPCSSMPASRRKHSPIALEKDEINPRQIQGKMVVTAGNSFEVAPSVFQRSIISLTFCPAPFAISISGMPMLYIRSAFTYDKAMAQRLLPPKLDSIRRYGHDNKRSRSVSFPFGNSRSLGM